MFETEDARRAGAIDGGARGGRRVVRRRATEEVRVLTERLRGYGLRPTRQRIDLATVLFSKGDRHVSAERVYAEALAAGSRLSLATVYNTLEKFTEAGLLRELAVSGAKSFFDTRVDPHHHFHDEETGTTVDVEASAVGIDRLPEPPEGMEIVGCEVTIRLRRRDRGTA